MPEGDSIWKLAAQLSEELVGLRVTAASLDGQTIRSTLVGCEVDDVFAVGKHLFVACGRDAIRSHLGMHGTWHRYVGRDPWSLPRRQARISITCEVERNERCTWVCFRAREADLVDLSGRAHQAFLRRLGPDLLRRTEIGIDLEKIVARARALAPETLLGDVLLDQSVASGIGNVWKSELCFLEGVLPQRAIRDVSDDELHRIYRRAREMLPRNLGPAKRSTRGPSPHDAAIRPDEDARYWVYRHAHQACDVCGSELKYARIGRRPRATYWCPKCQS